jgi:peptidoglycan/xylan/chitin deacetylase (PgdA/CDA1 family)
MHTLHLLSQTELTGAEVYAQVLSDSQTADGHQVYVISDKFHVPFKSHCVSMPISKSDLVNRFKIAIKLRQFLIKNKIQVIHCHSRAAVRHASLARMGLPIALVTTLHGRQHFSWSKRLIDNYGEFLIAICENVKLSQTQQFKTAASKIKVIENPFAFSTHEISKERSTKLRISWIGRSSGPKGERLLEFLAELSKSKAALDSTILDIVLTGNLSAEMESKIKSFGFTNLHIHGHLNLKEHWNICDAVVGSGRVAIEAAAHGIPVFCVGEYNALGWLTEKDFEPFKASNFGDIGVDSHKLTAPWPELIRQFTTGIKNHAALTDQAKAAKLKVTHQFSLSLVKEKIQDLYKQALFKRIKPQNIPILMYHMIPDTKLQTKHRIFVTKNNFERHLWYLKFFGFQTITLNQIKDFLDLKKPYSEFPKKPVLLTFDDGYKDNLKNAVPLLKKYGMTAQIFLLGKKVDHNWWDEKDGPTFGIMNAEERKTLAQSGVFEIGSHGNDHLKLTELTDDKVFQEMLISKSTLEQEFQTKITSVAYPFGLSSPSVHASAKKAGYTFGLNTSLGELHFADSLFNIFRVNVFPEDGIFSIWKKTRPGYRKYYFNKRGH